MKRDFIVFQREFQRWQKLFGLTGYKVYFKHEPLDDALARISVKQDNMVAVVRLSSLVHADDKPHLDVKKIALHEALHLLIARINDYAKSRYVTEDQLFEADEEIVNKLEGLLHHG